MNARRRLTAAGLGCRSLNHGAHLVVTNARHTIDFWPGTSLWIERGSSRRRYGVRTLIKHLTEQ